MDLFYLIEHVCLYVYLYAGAHGGWWYWTPLELAL